MTIAATRTGDSTFTVVGDQTDVFHTGRRVKLVGTASTTYGTISSVAYSTVTTVTLTAASDTIEADLLSVLYGVVSAVEGDCSMPIHDHDGDEGSGGKISHGDLDGLHQSVVSGSSPTFDGTNFTGGNIHSADDLSLGAVLTASGYNGTTITGTITGATPSIGSPLYGAASFQYTVADASATGTMPCIALATAASTGSQTLLLEGQIYNAAWTWVVGAIYVSLTTGALTQTAPSADGEFVQKVGFALSADTMYFKPDSTVIELEV